MPAHQVTPDDEISSSSSKKETLLNEPEEDIDDEPESEPNNEHLERVRAFYEGLPWHAREIMCARLAENAVAIKTGKAFHFYNRMYGYDTLRETENKFSDVERSLFEAYVFVVEWVETANKLNFGAMFLMIFLAVIKYFDIQDTYYALATTYAFITLVMMITAIGVSMFASFKRDEVKTRIAESFPTPARTVILRAERAGAAST